MGSTYIITSNLCPPLLDIPLPLKGFPRKLKMQLLQRFSRSVPKAILEHGKLDRGYRKSYQHPEESINKTTKFWTYVKIVGR